MQLSFDAADRLVELIHARRGPVPVDDAARTLFALASAPTAIARSLLDDVVQGDARLAWRGANVGLVDAPGAGVLLERARFVVFDLETTGLTPRTARICEIGAQRVEALELTDSFSTLVDSGTAVPAAVTALTGIDRPMLRGAPGAALATRRFLAFAADDVLVAHNARFDLAFLDAEVARLTGQRVAALAVDTVWLARRLLGQRIRRVSLAALAHFFGVSVEPCHRALPDAQATAEVLVALIGLAQERGARTVGDLVDLAAPRARRLHDKRALIAGAPTTPGVYVFRGAGGLPLYVGRARDLRARLRSYFAAERQRPAVEAALGALERVEWVEHGSELEAALAELRLLRELRPPANARNTRPDRHVYLRRRGDRWSVTDEETPFGPVSGGRRRAALAARCLDGHGSDDLTGVVARLRGRLGALARAQRFEDASRLRDRLAALEAVLVGLAELAELRAAARCVVVPARERGFVRIVVVVHGRVTLARTIPCGPGATVEAHALVAEARRGDPSFAASDADELLLVAGFLRKPPPELRVVALDAAAIAAAATEGPLALAV